MDLGIRKPGRGHRHEDPEHIAEIVVYDRQVRAFGQLGTGIGHAVAQLVPDLRQLGPTDRRQDFDIDAR